MLRKGTILFTLIFLVTCQKNNENIANEVKIRLSSDPISLSPINHNNVTAIRIINLLYEGLLKVDLEDGEVKPQLAQDLPEVIYQDSITIFKYTLRKEAKWDNQEPIVAEDVIFSLKAILCPGARNERIRGYFQFIKDIRSDPQNARKFSMVCEGYSPAMLLASGDFPVLPAYKLDPEAYLADYTLTQMINEPEKIMQEENIIKFVDLSNSPAYSTDKTSLIGSGPYSIQEWVGGQYIILNKKPDWWAESLNISYLTANPQTLNFQIIPDFSTALFALKNQEIDVISDIPTQNFENLKKDKVFNEQYQLISVSTYKSTYLGLNGQSDKLSGKNTRQALASLISLDQLIKLIKKGFALPTVGLIPPENKKFYNSELKNFPFDIKKARRLLEKDGWTKGREAWEKKINGKNIVLELSICYKSSDQEFQNIALFIKEAFSKLDIVVSLRPMEKVLFYNALNGRKFDLYLNSLSGNPFNFNFRPILHTENSRPGLPNYTGFGTTESDLLIDKINNAKNDKELEPLLKDFQRLMLEECNMIFLFFDPNCMAVHKKFTNLKISAQKPYYDVTAFERVKQ